MPLSKSRLRLRGVQPRKFLRLVSPAGVSVSDSDEEPVSKHPRLSGDISDQLTDDTGSYFEDDLEDLSVMDTSPSSALQTDDDIMVGTTGAVCVGEPGRKTSDVNDNYNTSTSANTATPLWEDGSRFNKSNRPARNYGIFYFPHIDTDSEQDGLGKALAPQKLGPVVPIDSSDKDDAWTYRGGTDENIRKQPLLSGSSSGHIPTATELRTLSGDSKKRSRQNELAKTLFVNDTNNITEIRGSIKESDVNSALMEEPEVPMTEGAPREGRKKVFAATNESKDCLNGDRSEESQQNCKVTTRELVNQVVKMTVRDFEPLVFTQTQAKQSRVKNWIKTNSHTFMRPQDSCDASGEYTTGDSDEDKVSDSSEDQNGSVATCKHQIGHGLDSRSCSTEVFQDPDATPVNEKTLPMLATPSPEHGKVVMRCRRRLATGEQRPWSVSGLSQLGLTGSDGALANFSISESALHQILATSATPTASSPQGLLEEGSGSRTGSLRRRKVRTRRRNTGRKSESGGSGGGSGGSDTQNKSSNNLAASNRTLTKSGSFSGGSPPSASEPAAQTVSSTEEEEQTTPVVTPQFRLGAKVTPVNPLRVREGSVGVNEEQLSSFSEQAWDNYQEKYMSEPNSEELADSEAARRLLEIDDDYRNFLDSQSDCMSSSVGTNQPRTVSPVRRRRQGALPLVDISVLDSDSDYEDVRDLIQQSQINLMFSENVFAKQLTKTSVDLNDFAQIAATCRDNVNVLHVFLGPKGEGDLLSSQDCREIRGLLSRWETLQSSVEDSQRVQAFERDISALRAELLQLAARVNTLQEFQDRAQLEARILKIKKELSDLKERKPQLLQVNHAVHRFLTDTSSHLGGGANSPPHPACVLKDDVAELYRVWDDAYNRISNHLVDLQRLSATWQQLEVTMSELQVDLDHDHNTLRLIDTSLKSGSVSAEVTAQVRDIANVLSEKQDHVKQEGALKSQTVLVPDLSRVSNPGLQFLSTEGGSLSDSGISDSGSENDLNGREKRLTALRQLARSMAAALAPGCLALLKINQELDQTESQLRSLQKSCRDLIVNTAVCMESNSLPVRHSSATSTHNGISRRRKSSTPLSKATSPDADPDDPDDKRRSGRWSWRLFRASLPFHVALVALFCVAWLLEPTCCDAMNNLVFSLTPQLRYVRGPPPT